MNRILLLGGNGFLGSHLLDLLREHGFMVRVFDKNHDPYREKFDDVEYINASFNDSFSLAESLNDIDIVIHTLSTSVPGTSNDSPVEDINGNLTNTVKLLNFMVKYSVKKILFISSGGTVYGIPKYIPIDEEHETIPICSYGIVKLSIEKYLLMYQHLYNIKPIILRVANLYGIRQRHLGVQGFISTVLNKMLKSESITIYGEGNIIRDYINVSDVVNACFNMLSFDITGIYNVGTGVGHSLNDIVEIVEKISGSQIKVNKIQSRAFDINKNILSIEKIKKDFNWEPLVDIEAGIKQQLNWLKERIKKL